MIFRIPLVVIYRDLALPSGLDNFVAYVEALSNHPAVKKSALTMVQNLDFVMKRRPAQPPPYFMLGQHQALRALDAKVRKLLDSKSDNDLPLAEAVVRSVVKGVWEDSRYLLTLHTRAEENAFFDAINKVKSSDVTQKSREQHGPLDESAEKVQKALESEAPISELKAAFEIYAKLHEQHLADEESILMAVIGDNPQIHVSSVRQALNTWNDDEKKKGVSIVVKSLQPGEQHRYLEALHKVSTADGNLKEWKLILTAVKAALGRPAWDLLVLRMSAQIPLSLQF
jgi:hemerythrin-like domain-containing protein